MSIDDLIQREMARVRLEQALALAGCSESAIEDAVSDWHWTLDYQASGLPVGEYVDQLLKRKPHWIAPKVSGLGADEEMIESAFGSKPTMAARGALLKAVGKKQYDALMADWQAEAGNLKPGVRPGTEAPAVTAASAGPKQTSRPCVCPCGFC
jgi:hypothetical protein